VELFTQSVEEGDVPLTLCAARPTEDSASGWQTVDTVTVNNTGGMGKIVQHLHDKGCRKMVHIRGPANIHDAMSRMNGFLMFTGKFPDVSAHVIDGGLEREHGSAAIEAYFAADEAIPDAFIAFNDSLAYGVLKSLQTRAIPVPRKVAVTGCDDEPASSILGLTTLRMPMRELGREAGRLLFDRLRSTSSPPKVQHSVLDLALRERSSSRLGHTSGPPGLHG
jgi:DNA-binding LacI/PurR family transcriptional regulator